MLRLMACSVRDRGVESIFTTGAVEGDLRLRQHPSDLVLLSSHSALAAYNPAEDGEVAVDAGHTHILATSSETQAQLTAEHIAAVTACVLRQQGVDDVTVADSVHIHHVTHHTAALTFCRCMVAAQATKSCCCI
jgi:hypothetical protein